MRTRYLKPGFFENEDLASLPATTRLLFAGLWLMADRDGRLRDRPARIKGELFSYENVNVERGLSQLATAGFIKRYEDGDGNKIIWIPKWKAHQRPHTHEPPSELALHPDDTGTDNVATKSDQSTDDAVTLENNVRLLPALNSNSNSDSKSEAKLDLNSDSDGKRPAATHRLNLSPDEWAVCHKDFPGLNVTALWRDWVLWIEKSEGAREPENKFTAFQGFLRGKRDEKVAAAAAR